MIKFFRNIRQHMIKENKMSKYLIYAIGEILLVVIGILIAFQVNNWKQDQENRAIEKEILSNIKDALFTDLQNTIKYNIEESNRRIIVTKALIDAKTLGVKIPDSVQKYYFNLGFIRDFSPVIIAFKILESKGLELIKNEKLKYDIVNLYSLEYEKINNWVENDNNNLRDLYRPEIRKHFTIYPPSHEIRFQPDNSENMLKDKDFMNAVTIMYANNLDFKNKFLEISEQINKLIENIQTELNKS